MDMVFVHLYSQSSAIELKNVKNTYTKDGLFCVMVHDDKYKFVVHRFPVQHIFRILHRGKEE